MPWNKDEAEEQTRMHNRMEELYRKGPTKPLPPIEEVNAGRKALGLAPVSQAEYDEEKRERQSRSAS